MTEPSGLSEVRGNVTAVQNVPRGAITCLREGLMGRGPERGPRQPEMSCSEAGRWGEGMVRAALIGVLITVASFIGGLVLLTVSVVAMVGVEESDPAAVSSAPVPAATREAPTEEPVPTTPEEPSDDETAEQAAEKEAADARRAERAEARAEEGKRIRRRDASRPGGGRPGSRGEEGGRGEEGC